ncbi:hypothetical protein F8M41_021785 [Gigaspora margarita]|uniref:Zinc-ribbon domain-containing protein n=1 Tax=Gigaspora margarita TaxID=4874 RepID=A0A8H4B1D5_GIGMA|nr:hypothetical protein F8M41_021785 [Gigaspora margarita]
MLWKCHQGHIWNTPFKNIKYSETWCPYCEGMPFQTKYSINDAHMIAKNRGEQCLSSSFINSMIPLQWRCAEGHEWTVSLVQIINSGSWCPHCAGNARCTIEDALDKWLKILRPNFRKTLEHPIGLELDIYYPEYGLAIEIQGVHFHKGDPNNFIKQRERDQRELGLTE